MNEKQFFSHIGFSYLAYGISIILAIIIISNIISFIPGTRLNANEISILNSICNYIIPIPVILLFLKQLDKSKIEKKRMSVKQYIFAAIIALTLMWVGNIFGLTITGLISSFMPHPVVNPVDNIINAPQVWFNILIVTILAPIFEELFFRKLLIDRTIKYGEIVSVLVSAVLFGLFHGNLNQFFYAFLIGGFFAIIYIKTGNILYTMSLHLIINFTGAVVPIIVNTKLSNLLADIGFTNITVFIIFIILIIISFIIYIKYDESFELEKSKVPLKTAFINPGMILFIVYEIIRIIFNTV